MAYQRPQGQYNKPAPKAAPIPAKAAPAPQAARPTGKGTKPDFEIVRVDEEGNVAKVEKVIEGETKLVSDRLGAIWNSKFEDGAQMVRMEDGTRAKIFPTKK